MSMNIGNCIIDGIEDVVFQTDLENKIRYINRSFINTLGYRMEEIIGKTIFDHIHELEKENFYNINVKSLRNNSNYRMELRIRKKDGHYIWLEIIGSIFYEEDNPKGIIHIGRDVSRRKLLEETFEENEYKLKSDKINAEREKRKLELSTMKYKRLIESLPDAILIREDRKIFFANRTAVRLLKAKNKEELKGKDVFQFIHWDFTEEDKEVMEDESVDIDKAFRRTKVKAITGDIIEVEVRTVPLKFEDRLLTLVVVRDLGDRIKAEEAERMLKETLENDRLRTEFFANLSHELRTPINVIYSALQVMNLYIGKREYTIKLKEYIDVIRQNCYRLIRLVNNLIDVTKIEAGYFETHMSYCNIVNIVEEIVDSVVEYVEIKDISIRFDTSEEEIYLCCDLDLIERILLNLISNSVKFGNKGGKIDVFIKKAEEDVVISVKDDGIGIPKEKQKNIFERFVRVDPSFTRNAEGSGIGLSLVQSLVKLQGGSISLISDEGNGCEFIIKLPISMAAEECCVTKIDEGSDIIKKVDVEFSDIYK